MPSKPIETKQRWFYISLLGSIFLVFSLFSWIAYIALIHYSEEIARDAAKRSADQLIATWSAISEVSPHLDTKDLDDRFAASPARLAVMISDKLSKEHGYYLKQTSKQYRNPRNRPDATESLMLDTLHDGVEEVWLRESYNGVDALRYGKALRIEQACLRCHGIPGVDVPQDLYDAIVSRYGDTAFNYKLGDVRGMVSVVFPMESFNIAMHEFFRENFWIGTLTILIVFLLIYLHNRLVVQPYIHLLKESHERLYVSAYRDQMTGLQNRRAFNQNIRENVESFKRSFWLLFIDLDDFKAVNDLYGHDAGDAVLITAAERMNALSRDCEVYRMGGDEFVMMVYHHNRDHDLTELLGRLVHDVRQPVLYKEKPLRIGISIGAAHYPDNGDQVEELIRHADLAMYSAKESGKNRHVLYNHSLMAEANAIKAMEHDLQQALQREEFFLLYQPQYDVKEGRIVGTEALLRWNHPTRGVLTPPAFISVAEECGLILDIGRWILFEACRQNREWQENGLPPIRMAVNVTSAQLDDLGFVMDLIDVVGETGLDPDDLEIEFIERAAINNEGNTIEFMNQLRHMRIHAAIDDFGTGYSSLSYISKFPIDKIKIDRLFVERIHEREDNAAIVRSVLSIAEHLEITVLAEGVETKEELDFLVKEGCTLIQGYYFSKPLTAEELVARLSEDVQKV